MPALDQPALDVVERRVGALARGLGGVVRGRGRRALDTLAHAQAPSEQQRERHDQPQQPGRRVRALLAPAPAREAEHEPRGEIVDRLPPRRAGRLQRRPADRRGVDVAPVAVDIGDGPRVGVTAPCDVAFLELAPLVHRVAGGVARGDTRGTQHEHGGGGEELAVPAPRAHEKVLERRRRVARARQRQRVAEAFGEEAAHALEHAALVGELLDPELVDEACEQIAVLDRHREVGRGGRRLDEAILDVARAVLDELRSAQHLERAEAIAVEPVHRQALDALGPARHRDYALAIRQVGAHRHRARERSELVDDPGRALGDGVELLELRAPRHPHVARERLVGRFAQQARHAAAALGSHAQHDAIGELELADLTDRGVGAIRIHARGDALLEVGHDQRLEDAARLDEARLRHPAEREACDQHRHPHRHAVTSRPVGPQREHDDRRERGQQQLRMCLAAGGGDEAAHQVGHAHVDPAGIGRGPAGHRAAHREEQRGVVDLLAGAEELRRGDREQHHRQPAQDAVDAARALGVELVDGHGDEAERAQIGDAMEILVGEIPAPRHPARELHQHGEARGHGQQLVVPAPHQQGGAEQPGQHVHAAAPRTAPSVASAGPGSAAGSTRRRSGWCASGPGCRRTAAGSSCATSTST